MKYLIYVIIAINFFIGCSSKNNFEPEKVIDNLDISIKNISNDIQSFKINNGITLKDGSVLVSSGLLKEKLPNNFNLINYNNNMVIAVNNNELMIGSETYKFNQEVVAATLKNNLLALVFIDNSISIYNIKIKKTIFKDYFEHSYLNDIKIVNPYFMDNLILFPMLNGKVIVVDSNTKKTIRTIAVNTSSDIKNIIFLGVIGENFIIANSNKILSIGNGVINSKEYDISNITTAKNNIYLTTIDGNILKLDKSLNVLASKKYKFANFFTIVYTNGSIYALESQGYIVLIDDNFTKDSIYKFEFDNTKYIVPIDNKIYFENKFLEIK
jgi:hypothetical protein